MNSNHFKLLNHLKELVQKLSKEKDSQGASRIDILHLIKKLPPTVSSSTFVKQFEKSKAIMKIDIKGVSGKYLPILQDIKNKITDTEVIPQKVPKWQQVSKFSHQSITSRTTQVLLQIEGATSDTLLKNRIEELIVHIKQYPDARMKSIKEGAIRLILKARAKTTNVEVQETIREALALLGYVDPLPRNGIRILAIDGGGIRGLLVLEMLKKIEEITGQRVHELFDFFCGVSTGAILTYLMALHKKPLDEISEGYLAISKEVFQQSPLWGTGNLVWSHSYYNTALWEKRMREGLGEAELISTSRDPNCPKMCSVSAVVNQSRIRAFLFRNYSIPWRYQSQYAGSCDAKIWEAARASAAAPTYFEEFKLGNLLHQDGGILTNNPTAIALHEAKLLWPNTPIQCVLSFGTGRTIPSPSDFSKDLMEDSLSTTSWANKFLKILDSATDTEAVHTMLNDLLPPHVYYRFNPYLTELITMVETDPKKIDQLKRDALMYLRRNEEKFHEASKKLTEKKSFSRNIKDIIQYQREYYGI